MAQDPYGFEESTGTGGDPGSASRAMWMGMTGAMLASVGVCFCYVPYAVALPFGIYGAWTGWKALNGGGAVDQRDRNMATAGLVSGGISSLISAAFVAFMILYVLFLVGYMVLVFGLIGAGAMSQH